MNSNQLLRDGAGILASIGIDAAKDARILLQLTLDLSHEELVKNIYEPVQDQCIELYYQYLMRRRGGEPLAYICGVQCFYGEEFEVNPHVLIPRPETELILNIAARYESDPSSVSSILDIGTGSGCLAILLAKMFPGSQVVALDVSPEALDVASRNASRILGTNHLIHWVCEDFKKWLSESTFSLVVSNPPYLSDSEIAPNGYEPKNAFFGGEDGLDFYVEIARRRSQLLEDGSKLLLEIGSVQSQAVQDLFQPCYVHHDFANLPRVVEYQYLSR